MTTKQPTVRPALLGTNARTESLVTPEGVRLDFVVASVGERLVAFMVDVGIAVAAVVVMWLGALAFGYREGYSLLLLLAFLLRNFYFMYLEQRLQGRTIGKRLQKIQVIDATGGQLTVEAVIVRNLTRDLEIFLPLGVLLLPQQIWPDAPWWSWILASAWLVIFALLPFFNRQRRRIGDLIAGTLVIASPQVDLRSDLAAKVVARSETEEKSSQFTQAQLSHYGIYELQVLEKVLRNPANDENEAILIQVSQKIRTKIDWRPPVTNHHAFLSDFYAAQRAHLEGRLLLGKRRADKFTDDD